MRVKTAKPVPIYRSHDETYAADNCEPLADAARRNAVVLRALVHGHYPGKKLPAGALPGLKTAGFWDAERVQAWGLPWHRNEGIEITFLENGRTAFGVDDREYVLEADALTVTRPWQRHHVGDPNVGAGRLHWVILDVGVRRPNQDWRWPQWVLLSSGDREELSNILRQTSQPLWTATGEMQRCFRALADAVESDDGGSSVSAVAIRINELLLLLLALLRKQRPRLNGSLTSSRRTVELFFEDLAKHPEHLAIDWSVDEMARSCGLGVTQFVHVSRQVTNATPLHYVNGLRLELAARLLRDCRMAVTQVSLECGFSSSQYFARVFRQRYRCSPSEYRRR